MTNIRILFGGYLEVSEMIFKNLRRFRKKSRSYPRYFLETIPRVLRRKQSRSVINYLKNIPYYKKTPKYIFRILVTSKRLNDSKSMYYYNKIKRYLEGIRRYLENVL